LTSLTIYTNDTSTSTLSTAKSLLAVGTSTTSTSNTTKVGTLTGYGEVYAAGFGANWPALGSLGSPSGNGALYDTTALEGQTFVAGNWSAQLRLHTSVAGITADLYLRLYKYNAGAYTLIGTLTAPGTTLTTSLTNYAFAATSMAATPFATGDKLYLDFWADVTANTTGNAGTTISWDAWCTVGGTGDSRSYVITPGYVVAGTAAMQSNSALSEAAQIVATALATQSNSVASQASAQVLASAAIQGNSVASLASAQIVASASMQSNSALVATAIIPTAGSATASDAPAGSATASDAKG
jgi:hypothetical protein